jgi:FMN reductase
MSNPTVVGFSGNITRPSKTRAFVDLVTRDIAARHGLSASTYDIEDLGRSLGTARWARDLDSQAHPILEEILAADVLVVGSPTYKGSYTGLFKHFFDLIDPAALRGKPILLTATGGGERHALIVEHQLRPLFGFFQALVLPLGIYATEADFDDYRLASKAVADRITLAVDQALPWLIRPDARRLPALRQPFIAQL